jgi:hypothetical protein
MLIGVCAQFSLFDGALEVFVRCAVALLGLTGSILAYNKQTWHMRYVMWLIACLGISLMFLVWGAVSSQSTAVAFSLFVFLVLAKTFVDHLMIVRVRVLSERGEALIIDDILSNLTS